MNWCKCETPYAATCGACGRSWCDRCDPVSVSWGRRNRETAIPRIIEHETRERMMTMTIEMKQGITEDGRDFGYVCGDDGGWFFTPVGIHEVPSPR